MTKRKRSPSPTPPSRKPAVFEIPPSIFKFQAIARELARQSELLLDRTSNIQEQRLPDSPGGAADAPRFDAKSFQTNALRFSPYTNQPVLLSQPWPQDDKDSSPARPPSKVKRSGVAVRFEADRALLHREDIRPSPIGPEDQLADELNHALAASQDVETHDQLQPTSYHIDKDHIPLDQRLPNEWNSMRPATFQHFPPNYPAITHYPSQSPYSSTITQHFPRNSADLLHLPSGSPPNPSSPFYSSRPPPPHPGAQSSSNMPGYYKTSLKLWSQEDPDSNLLTQPSNQYLFTNIPYQPANTYTDSSSSYPPPPTLASSPVTAFTSYGNVR